MKYCDKCKVKVRGNSKYCPLCQNELNGQDDRPIYPHIPTVYKQYELFFKILILSTVSAGVVSLGVNFILPETGYWSLLVVFGIACFWIMLSLAAKKMNSIPQNITYQVVIVSILSVLWDLITGWRGWSVDFVIPVACIIAMVSMAVLAKVMHIAASDYIICMIISGIFGVVPVVFYFTGLLTVAIPSVVCITFSAVSFTALIIFEGKNMKQEVIRRFHI